MTILSWKAAGTTRWGRVLNLIVPNSPCACGLGQLKASGDNMWVTLGDEGYRLEWTFCDLYVLWRNLASLGLSELISETGRVPTPPWDGGWAAQS